MLSQAGCEIFKLRAEAEQFPMLLFCALYLANEDVGEFIDALPRCRMDPWSSSLIASYEDREGTWEDWAHDFRANL